MSPLTAILTGAKGNHSGCSVSGGGDINGDGFADFIIGDFGKAHVVYGSGAYLGDIDLSTDLTSAQGFVIKSSIPYYDCYNVREAGDVNGDGYADIIIGASSASPMSRYYAGQSYIIYGSSSPETIDLSTELTSSQGYTVLGAASYDASGYSVSTAGDINGDGYADIIIGAANARGYAGQSDIIYGSSSNPGTIDLSTNLSTVQGFTVLGGAAYDYCGSSVRTAGDVNNDGYADIIIGAQFASPTSRSYAGQSYIFYGGSSNPGTIDLSTALTALQGFAVLGGAEYDYSGVSVNTAGDVNDDGYADIIIGAAGGYSTSKGVSVIIYGSATNPGTMDLSAGLTVAQGFMVLGGAAGDRLGSSVSTAGDVNKDGYADIIIGAPHASPNSREHAGQSYVIYGSGSNPGTMDLAVLTAHRVILSREGLPIATVVHQ
jgi:hypothetical protein